MPERSSRANVTACIGGSGLRTVDEAKRAAKRRYILAAAKACFSRHGFRGASISDICAEAKMSPGHLYHYFASKEAMVRAIVADDFQDAIRSIDAVAPSTGADFAAAVVAAFARAMPNARDSIMIEILAEAARNPTIVEMLRELDRAIQRRLTELLRQRQALGEIDARIEPQAAAAVLMALYRGCMSLTRLGLPVSRRQMLDALHLAISRFLAPNAGLPRRSRSGARKGKGNLTLSP